MLETEQGSKTLTVFNRRKFKNELFTEGDQWESQKGLFVEAGVLTEKDVDSFHNHIVDCMLERNKEKWDR